MGTIFVDRAKYAELFGDPLVDAYHVFFKPEADPDTTYESRCRIPTERACSSRIGSPFTSTWPG